MSDYEYKASCSHMCSLSLDPFTWLVLKLVLDPFKLIDRTDILLRSPEKLLYKFHPQGILAALLNLFFKSRFRGQFPTDSV